MSLPHYEHKTFEKYEGNSKNFILEYHIHVCKIQNFVLSILRNFCLIYLILILILVIGKEVNHTH